MIVGSSSEEENDFVFIISKIQKKENKKIQAEKDANNLLIQKWLKQKDISSYAKVIAMDSKNQQDAYDCLFKAHELIKEQTMRLSKRKKCSRSCKIQQYNDCSEHPDINCPARHDYYKNGQDATKFDAIRVRLQELGIGDVIG